MAKAAILDDAAVDANRRHVTRLVQEPEAFPFVDNLAEIFGCEQQLFHTVLRPRRIDWQKAAAQWSETQCKGGNLK